MMAAVLNGSSQYLVNSATPITAYPFSVGVWVYPTTNNTLGIVFEVNNAAAAFMAFYQNSASWTINVDSTAATTVNTLAANTWHYLVVRFISSTSRRLAVLQDGGAIEHLSDTTLVAAPASLDNIVIGAHSRPPSAVFFSGRIAELFYTRTDIQPDGAQLQSSLLQQLAYGGPFSVPHIAADVVEYRSFFSHPDSSGEKIGEVYHGAAGRQTWANTTGVTTGAHPSLPYWYVKPDQTIRRLMV